MDVHPSVVHSMQDVRADPATIYSNGTPLQQHGERSSGSRRYCTDV